MTFPFAQWIGIAAAVALAVIAGIALKERRLAIGLAILVFLVVASWTAHAWSVSVRVGERRELQARLGALEAAAWSPGSALACLGEAHDDQLADACERALFATPQSVNAAVSFTAARLALLQDADALAATPSSAVVVDALRAALEQDRYGFTAYALKQRYACTVERCKPIGLLRQTEQVRANLHDGLFERKLAQHKNAWLEKAAPAEAETPPPPPAPQASASAPPFAPVPPNFTLPSSDSIPPVSIMNPEPGTSSGPSPREAATAPATPPVPPARSAAPRSRGAAPAPAPLQLAPGERR
jgi:hypothetical protein